MSVSYTFSSSYHNVGTHPNVYHRRVLVEKTIKGHTYTADEEIPMPKQDVSSLWTAVSELKSGFTSDWITYDFKELYVDFVTETKPHLIVSEKVRKATTKRPPDLIKKFGSSYSGQGFNRGNRSFNRSRQFSRKAF